MTSKNVLSADTLSVLYHIAPDKPGNTVFMWSVDMSFIFLEQTNVTFMGPLYEAVIMHLCFVKGDVTTRYIPFRVNVTA